MDERTTILYVDDNLKSSRLLTCILEGCEFQVINASDPVEALELCRRTPFDLALLDYDMPRMTGSQLAQEIKFMKPDLPIVMISGEKDMPATERVFVGAHFGLGTCLDDLLWSMRVLAAPSPLVVRHQPLPACPDST